DGDRRGRRLRRLSNHGSWKAIAMANTIRVRAVSSGEVPGVQALVQHPMDSGFVKDAQGNLIPPHHIEVVDFQHAGKTVFTALWGPAGAKDPYIKFSFKG